MPTCIYCRSTSSKRYPAEHVIPKSFGRFRHGLTLHCVCGECNHFFANHLELHFARETSESVSDTNMVLGIQGLVISAAA